MEEDAVWRKVLADENKRRVVTELKERKIGVDGEEWPVSKGGTRDAAVLVPLVMAEGQPSVLFTVRSQHVSRHRQQVSFPGGLADPSDGSPEGTALREANEELGIASHDVEVWGRLNRFPDRHKSSSVVPVLGRLSTSAIESMKLNSAEVHHAFTLPLQHLANPKNSGYTQLKHFTFRFPVYMGGTRRIWGLTGFVLDVALMLLLPRKLYSPISTKR